MNDSRPLEINSSEISSAGTSSASGAMPTLTPGESQGGIATWLSGKRVNAMWGINQNRNVFVGIAGVGWKKLANNSDSAIVALTMLAAHAKLAQKDYNYREESDGMIHETYVW